MGSDMFEKYKVFTVKLKPFSISSSIDVIVSDSGNFALTYKI